MRLLQINSVYGYGSTGRIVKDIHQAALEKGIDSYVAYGRGQHKVDRLIKIGTKKDLIYHGLKTRFFDQHGLASKNATRSFIEYIKELQPDVIHLHNIHGYFLNYPIFFEYLKSIEVDVIWTMHDCWAFTGHCSYYSYIDCNKWQTHCEKCPQISKYPKSLKFDNSYNNFDQKKKSFQGVKKLNVITPSRWLAGELKKSFLKDYSVITIHNGIDLKAFYPLKSDFRERYGLIDKKIIMGIASVWDERKGLSFFIELSKLLKEDEVILLVGAKKTISLEGMLTIERTENIHELAEIYSAADVLLNPTLEDNYPTVNLESIACGTPVVVNDIGGVRETLIGDYGRIFDDYNPLIAIRLIRELFEDKNKLISDYNEIPMDEISFETMTDNYVKVYQSLKA